MRADLRAARDALTHPGMRGAAFEDTFRTFLKTYLPRSLDVSTGVLVDSAGQHSRQLDVIVSDAAKTPVLYSVGETRVIPVECAYMAIEVKAHLDKEALLACIENMLSVRALQKKAYIPDSALQHNFRMYGREWAIYPVNYFVFAFDSVDIRRLAELLLAEYIDRGLQVWTRIDSICVLDQGVITNRHANNMVDALPAPGSAIQTCRTDKALLLFYTLISTYFHQAWIPPFRFLDYLDEKQFGVDSASDDVSPNQST